MNTDIEVYDWGDACEETRQWSPYPPFFKDSLYYRGAAPDPG